MRKIVTRNSVKEPPCSFHEASARSTGALVPIHLLSCQEMYQPVEMPVRLCGYILGMTHRRSSWEPRLALFSLLLHSYGFDWICSGSECPLFSGSRPSLGIGRDALALSTKYSAEYRLRESLEKPSNSESDTLENLKREPVAIEREDR